MVDVAHRRWDFALTVATVVLLATLGLQSFIGTLYSWWAQRTIPAWQTLGYTDFVTWMNVVAAPQIIALVVVMGLCVPKRLFDRGALIGTSAAMVLIGAIVAVGTGHVATGLAVYLLLAGSIQVAVVAMTVAGARGPSYLTEGRLTKTGSGLLHLGFIVFAFVIVALQRSRFMLGVFAVAALLMVVGMTLSFYAGRLAVRRSVTISPSEANPSDEGAGLGAQEVAPPDDADVSEPPADHEPDDD